MVRDAHPNVFPYAKDTSRSMKTTKGSVKAFESVLRSVRAKPSKVKIQNYLLPRKTFRSSTCDTLACPLHGRCAVDDASNCTAAVRAMTINKQ